MACCIFMAMLITNYLVFYRKLKALFGFKVNDDNSQRQPPAVVPVWRRYMRLTLPLILVASTVTYGSMHWHHITAWVNPDACNTIEADNLHACEKHHH